MAFKTCNLAEGLVQNNEEKLNILLLTKGCFNVINPFKVLMRVLLRSPNQDQKKWVSQGLRGSKDRNRSYDQRFMKTKSALFLAGFGYCRLSR